MFFARVVVESLKPHSTSMVERFAAESVLMLYNGKRLLAYLGKNTIPRKKSNW